MDTDDLSMEAYNAVILETEKYDHDLTLRFGVLAGYCDDETEYLASAKELINDIRKLDDFDLEDLFFGAMPDKVTLLAALNRIESNIAWEETISINKRQQC